MENEVRIVGLTVRQRNALQKAFESGEINALVNRSYMSDLFESDQIRICPLVELKRQNGITWITYRQRGE